MTVEATQARSHAMWTPDPWRQRLANFTVEDVLSFPDDAPRVELRDGVVIVVPSPTFGHQAIVSNLWQWFRAHAPRHLLPSGGTGLLVDAKDALEPDLLLLQAETIEPDRHYSTSDQVVIAVEVVSHGTTIRDRLEKPPQYAAAGIRHYWRIEQDPVHVFAYELGADGTYRLVADSTEELVVEKPFEIRLPISEITP